MKPILMAMIPVSFLALAAPVVAGEVAPGDVQFQDGAVTASLSGAAGDADSGKKVMTTRSMGNCVACHQVDALSSAGFHGTVGPSLNGAGSRYTEEQLRGIVANAKMTFDGSMMPSFYKKTGYIRPGDAYTGKAAKEADLSTLLTAQQIEDVVAFLKTLKE